MWVFVNWRSWVEHLMAPNGSVLSLMQSGSSGTSANVYYHPWASVLTGPKPCLCIVLRKIFDVHGIWLHEKKNKRRNSRGEGFILAWKSGINSNVSTLWSKEAPRKSSFWSTSQSWSWDLQNQLELNEFARTVLDWLEQGMLRSGGSSSGTLPAAGLPWALQQQKPKFCRPENLRHSWAPLWGVSPVVGTSLGLRWVDGGPHPPKGNKSCAPGCRQVIKYQSVAN